MAWAARRVLIAAATLSVSASAYAAGASEHPQPPSSGCRPTSVQSSNVRPRTCAKTTRLQGIGILQLGGRLVHASHLPAYSYVLIGSADFQRAALPGKVLYYTSGFSVPTTFNAGVPYSEARTNGWLLTDAAGHDLIQAPAPQHAPPVYIADVGNPLYQRAFIRNVLDVLRKNPHVDGIMVDNVSADPSDTDTCSCLPKAYPRLVQWQSATIRFMAAVGTALRTRGYYVLANASGFVAGPHRDDEANEKAWWKRLAPHVSGLMDEYWMQSPNNIDQLMNDSGTGTYGHWLQWLNLMNVAQSHGVDFFGVTYGSKTDLRKMRFAKGTFLLGWNGKGGAMIYNTDQSGGGDPWNLAWTANIGKPRGRTFRLGPARLDLWARLYTRGTVVVNPSSRPETVAVRNVLYMIAPSDALILG